MIHRWETPAGIALAYKRPATTLDVIEGQRLLIPFACGAADGASLGGLVAWVASHVCRLEGVDWSTHDALDRIDALDHALSAQDVVDLAQVVINSAGLSANVFAEAKAYMGLIWGGGCECMACKGLTSSDERCLRIRHPERAQALVNNWWPLRASDTAHAPYWVHQIRLIHDAAEAAALAQERKKTDRRNAWRDKLNQRGLM